VSADYVTDVVYHRSFVSDLSPSRLRLAAALNGFPAPSDADFDYCELGSAHGDTTAILAAANPAARFLGIDLNPTHIDAANRSAREGELTNVSFLELDFESLREQAIPDLDFICAHGVLSWVGPAKRKALLDFVSRKLKPGGLLYVGYNAMPGWAAVEPLRQLLVTGGASAKDDTSERARLGFALAKHMHDAGAIYFKGNPSATAMLQKMEELGLPYIAHEYLNAHWTPMYFAQVAQDMAEKDLYFVGQLPLYSNYRDLVLPPPMHELFASIGDRATFETLKDFALNEFFRRDVFIKGKTGRAAATTQAYLDSTEFGLLGALPVEDVRLPHGTLTFEGPLFEAIFAALEQGGATGKALTARAELAAFGTDNVRAALLRAVVADRVVPLERSKGASGGRESRAGARVLRTGEDLLRVPSAYNRMILRQTPKSEVPFVLASPVLGTGIPTSPLEALAIRLLTEAPTSKWQDWLRDLFVRQGYRLNVRGRVVEGAAERTQVVLAEVERFRESRLARFIEWNILE